MGDELRLTVLGARGSVPISGQQYDIFGGATSSYLIEAGEHAIFLDAGNGIINSPPVDEDKKITILMSHTHLDHIIGLPFFPELSKKDRYIDFYGADIEGHSIAKLIEEAFSEPYWPLTIGAYPSNFHYRQLKLPMTLGSDIEITGVKLRHPGGCTGFGISYKGKRIVYLTDYEMLDEPDEEVVEFSKDADLLLCDAQYLDDEFASKKGFGHSTISKALSLFEMTGAGQMLLVHHDPKRSDEELMKLEKTIELPNVRFARQGESVVL